MEPILSALTGRKVFIAYRLVPNAKGGTDKIPFDPKTGHNSDAQDPATWMTPEVARTFGVPLGIVLDDSAGLFCIDLDSCAVIDAAGNVTGWSPLAHDMLARFPGACVEVSVSGRSLHIMGSRQQVADHRTKRKDFPGLEVYSRRRFIALTGWGMYGDIRTDHTAALQRVIAEFLPGDPAELSPEWTTEPNPSWRGGGTDEQIIAHLMRDGTAKQAFGGGCPFSALWECDAGTLQRYFPTSSIGKDWDGSGADQALANHLAYATGYNCEHTLALMLKSKMSWRQKWERDDYLARTILKAVAGKVELRTPPTPTPPAASALPPSVGTPVTQPSAPAPGVSDYIPKPGDYVSITQQQQLFAGCVYVEDVHQIMTADASMLAQKQFDARFGGLEFQMTVDGSKPSRSAWECFLDSHMAFWPKVRGLVFDPRGEPRCVIVREGQRYMNSWQPVPIERAVGDAGPFIAHLRALYPSGQDAEILLAYFAALVQYPGVKFQWAPLLQGVEGNGKTFFSHALEHCVGQRYTHHPKASQLDSRFNSAFEGKLLICVEDVFISDAKASMWETLKPMITSTRMEIEGKGVDKVSRDVCFNFIMNSNHKDAVRKTANDRRIAPFYGAQQHVGDLIRCGLTEDYFRALYKWGRGGGFAVVADFLLHYAIPEAINPGGDCVRAPRTTSTDQAIQKGRGSIEQEIFEALDEGRPGFRGGWVSSFAFDNLLAEIGKSKQISRERRREIIDGMGYRPHPSLPNGRVLISLPDGTRPVLYVPKDGTHPSEAPGLLASDIARQYVEAQALKVA